MGRSFPKRPWPIPLLATLAAVGALMGGLLVGYEPVGGDPDRLYRPLKTELARALHQGQLPFWSERFGMGVPLVAESHVAAFYPPNLVLYRLLDVSRAYRLSMWGHYLLLAATTYAYALRLGASPWGSALSALSFTFCGFQAIHSSHEPLYSALPYLPLALWLAEAYVETGRLGWAALLALTLGVQLTLGHFQIPFWTGGLAILTGLWKLVTERRPSSRALILILATAWGGAVAAVQLVPTWELAQFLGMTRRPFRELAGYSYPPEHWGELAIPGVFRRIAGGPEGGYWLSRQSTGYEACLYVGTVPLILAFVGVAGTFKSSRWNLWRILMVASAVLATIPRWWPSGYAAILQLPGFGYFRAPGRYTMITSLALALFAGKGFDRAVSSRRWHGGTLLALCFALAAALGSQMMGLTLIGGSGAKVNALGWAALAWLTAIGVLYLWKTERVGAWAPFAVTAVELGLLYYHSTTLWGWAVPLPESSLVLQRLASEPGARLVDGLLDDLPVRAGLSPAFPYMGFPSPPPHHLLKNARQRGYGRDPLAVRLMRRMGVTHGVWNDSLTRSDPHVVYSGIDPALDSLAYNQSPLAGPREWTIVRYKDPLPEARVALRLRTVPDFRSLMNGLAFSEAQDEAFLFTKDQLPGDSGPRAIAARVVRWNGRDGLVEHDGTCDLVLARTYYPGWSARINDSTEMPTYRVDGGLQAVRLDGKGPSTVSIRYRPTGLDEAATLSIGATALACVIGLASMFRSKHNLS